MCEKNTKTACSVCPPLQESREPGSIPAKGDSINVPLISNLFLILLPKCSFCLLAYTSSILLCTRNETMVATSVHSSPLTIALTSAFCLFILGGILLNRRGTRTRYALMLALIGIGGMLVSVTWGGGTFLYYLSNALVFLGIWINGSFLYIWNHLRQFAREMGSMSLLRVFRTR